MQLITLNAWGGKVFEPLMRFLEEHAADTDIFCFQEVLFCPRAEFLPQSKARINLFTEIQERLKDFTALEYPAPREAGYFENEPWPSDMYAGQAIFVRNSLAIKDHGGFRTYRGGYPKQMTFGGKVTGSCQWVEIETSGGNLTVLNLHGIWQKDTNKIDTPERLLQSNIINDFLATKNGKEILCGDFNLRPDGESMKILERNLKNLITEFGVTSTRSELYSKSERFADYVLVSPEVIVESFTVLPDVVSDHLPLVLRFH